MKTEWIEKLKELEIALDTGEQVEIPDGMFLEIIDYIVKSQESLKKAQMFLELTYFNLSEQEKK